MWKRDMPYVFCYATERTQAPQTTETIQTIRIWESQDDHTEPVDSRLSLSHIAHVRCKQNVVCATT